MRVKRHRRVAADGGAFTRDVLGRLGSLRRVCGTRARGPVGGAFVTCHPTSPAGDSSRMAIGQFF